MGNGLAAGGHHHRAHHLDQATLAGVFAVRLALVRSRAARAHQPRDLRLELARPRRPRALRRRADLARPTLESTPREDLAGALEPGAARRCGDAAPRPD